MVHPDVRLDVDRRARRTWAGGGPGVGGDVLGGTAAGVAGPEAKAGAGAGDEDDEDDEDDDQGSPGLVAVADDEPQGFQVALVARQGGPGAPSSVGRGVQKTAPTVVTSNAPAVTGTPRSTRRSCTSKASKRRYVRSRSATSATTSPPC